MTTSADWVTRARTEMYNLYTSHLASARRVVDLVDEVEALGGPALIFVEGFPPQGDDFDINDMVAAYTAMTALIAEPTQEQKNALIKARRS